MDHASLADRIVEAFDSLPEQLGAAARYVLDNPDDVALLSMREQAKRAGVQPWTMTRLAKRLGYDGYDSIREVHADAIRNGTLGFSGKAGVQVARQKASGDKALAAEIALSVSGQIAGLAEPPAIEMLTEAAAVLGRARRIFCLGLRSSHPIAAHFAYVMSFFGERAVLLGSGAAGLDAIRLATPEDVLFAISVAPYTRATVETAQHAEAQGVPIVALTDSLLSPLAGLARRSILITTESPSFFHSMAPAFAAAEILAALIAGQGGEESLRAIEKTERQLAAFGIHLQPHSRKPS